MFKKYRPLSIFSYLLLILFPQVKVFANSFSKHTPLIFSQTCFNKYDQKIISGFPHPTQGLWIPTHDFDRKERYYGYCLDTLGRLPIMRSTFSPKNNQDILIVEHFSHGYKSWVARIDLTQFTQAHLININFALVLGHHPLLRIDFNTEKGILLYEYGENTSWTKEQLLKGENASVQLNSLSLDVEGVSQIGDTFGAESAATGRLALTYLFISTVEKVFYSVLSNFKTRQYTLKNLNKDSIRKILETFITHSENTKISKAYNVITDNCINSLVRVLQSALPELNFTDYELWEPLAPYNLADILVRKNLLDEHQIENFLLFDNSNLFFGNHFNGLEQIQKSYLEIEKEKQDRLYNQRNSAVAW
jgi:hypothetical protein